MYRAKNQALFLETNVEIAEIREIEIEYYTGVYKTFAQQAALIGGFTFAMLREIKGDHRWLPDLDSWYAVFSTITILCAVHIVLCSLYLQVYAPGLAIYGKVGSMTRTCEVLKKEEPMIMKSFCVMIFFFVFTTAALFWEALDYIGAILCTFGLIFAMSYWYKFLYRIYAQLSFPGDPVFSDLVRPSRDSISPIEKLEQSGALKVK